MDKLFINDIDVMCIIGVEDWEREEKRPLRLQVELECTLHPGCATDQLDGTLNYDELYHRIRAKLETSSFHLIEAMGDQVAMLCLEYERVSTARITVEKPRFLTGCRSVAIMVERYK